MGGVDSKFPDDFQKRSFALLAVRMRINWFSGQSGRAVFQFELGGDSTDEVSCERAIKLLIATFSQNTHTRSLSGMGFTIYFLEDNLALQPTFPPQKKVFRLIFHPSMS